MRYAGNGMARLAPCVAAPALAAFDQPTICTGPMRFCNEDVTFTAYASRLGFDRTVHRTRATNTGNGSATDDRGRCDSYLGQGCRHMVSAPGEEPQTHCDFTLTARGGDRYLYAEALSDGFSGTALLTCLRQKT